jgi:RsiW-degrading membrane proteinase PrsW (M82 family)
MATVAAAYERIHRPARYRIAATLVALVLLVLAVTAVFDYGAFEGLPGRLLLFAVPAVIFVTLGTYLAVQAFDRQPERRHRHLLAAGGLLAGAIVLWLLVLDVFVFTQDAGPLVSVICGIACLPTTAFGLLVVRRLDRNEKEPWRLVLAAAAWGAIVATSLVIVGEGLWQALSLRTLVPGPGLDASIALSAGLFEELAKGAAVLLLFLVMRNEFDDVVDGIVYGAAVGLGFNFMESISYMTYLYSVFDHGQGAVAAGFQWYGRQVLGLFFGHATYTALVGAGIGIARQLASRRAQLLSIASGWLIAIAAHFSWDAWLTFFPISHGLLAFVEIHLRTLFMDGPYTTMTLVLLLLGLRLEGQALSRQLAAEAATGLGAVLPGEVRVLASPWQRFATRWRAMDRGGGFRAYARMAQLQNAQLDLAMERWHRERKEIDEPLTAEELLRRRVLALRGQPSP